MATVRGSTSNALATSFILLMGVGAIGGFMTYYASHFATRMEALEELLEEDPTKSNKMVQGSAKQHTAK